LDQDHQPLCFLLFFLRDCRRHGINPFEYLKDLFTRLLAAKIAEIKEFTPAAWAKAKAKDQAVAQAT